MIHGFLSRCVYVCVMCMCVVYEICMHIWCVGRVVCSVYGVCIWVCVSGWVCVKVRIIIFILKIGNTNLSISTVLTFNSWTIFLNKTMTEI